jgi:hypothetical protein
MNVAIGLINLKNSASFGDCPSIGCDTNINEYSTVATININVNDNTTPTMKRSSSSGDQYLTFFDNFFLTCIYQPFGAVAHSDAPRFLAEFVFPVRRVLAIVAVAVFAASKHQRRQY